jgi:transcriptional regulator with XRE-family HTH domain
MGRPAVKKGKDPEGYPGDEAVRKALGHAIREIREARGLTRKETVWLLQKEQEKTDSRIYGQALAIRLKATRTMRRMTRLKLARASNVPVRLIVAIERNSAEDIDMGDIIRLCLGMRYDVGEFMDDIHKLSLKLEAESKL